MPLSRREFLERSALALGALAAGGTLNGCGGGQTPASPAPPQLPTVAPTLAPSPTSGLLVPTTAPATGAAPTAAPATAVPATTAPASAAAPTLAAATPTVVVMGGTPTVVATRQAPPTAAQAYLAVARGADPAAITRAAVDALGGMKRFVKKGDDVIIKPNICNASHGPEYASTTNPDVVAALVAMCLEEGAARVRVMDYPFSGGAAEAYRVSGIRAAVEKAGGQMELMNQVKFVETQLPATARDLKTARIYQDVIKANVLIDVPIAKSHGSAGFTLGMKGLMGVIWDRNTIHWAMDQRLADLSTVIKPTLTVVDGVRVLLRNGPTGGNLKDVAQMNTIIASHDVVCADGYALQTLFQVSPDRVGYVRLGGEMGLGRYDFKNLAVREVQA